MSLGAQTKEPAGSRSIRQAGSPPLQGGTILVVDDTPASLKLLADTLTAEGYQVLLADSGELALTAVAARPPELILLDIRMAGLDGFEVCRRLKARAESRDIPIMFISAAGESAERVEGFKLGAVDFISKPFQYEELLARVHTHLELRRFRVRLEQQASELRQANEQLRTELGQRQQTEEALSKSEEQYRTLFNSIDEGFCIVQVIFDENEKPIDYRFLTINPSFEKQTGLINAQGKRMRELAPKHEEHWFEIYGKIAVTGQPARFVNRAEQLHRWYDVYAFRIGQPEKRQVVILFNDITERKRTEEELACSLSLLQATLESTADGLLVVNQTGQMVQFNQKFAEMWRIPADILASRDDSLAIGFVLEQLKDPGSFVAKVKELYAQPEAVSFDVLEFKDGRTFERYSQPQKVTGKAVGRVWSFRDITERKQAEDALRESKTRYAALFEHNPIETIFVDLHGKIQAFNRAKRESGDRLPQIGEVMYRDYASKHTMDMHGELMHCIRLGESRHYPERPYGKRILYIDIAPFPDGAIITSQDFTERRQAEEALQREFAMRSMLLENLPCIAMVLRKGTREIVFLNEKARQAGAAPGKTCYGTCSQRSDPCPFCLAPEVWATNQPRQLEVEYRGQHYDGRWVPLTDDLYVHYIFDITDRKQTEESLRELSLRFGRAVDKERRRIARELHDSTGQKLAALSMSVGVLQDATGFPDGKKDKLFADCLAMIEQCAQEIRTLSYLLHPPLLDELGLAVAIGNYIEGFSKRSGVQVALDAPPGLERLPAEVEITLFRVAQESLGNIHRHAGASTARIHLACDVEQVILEVSDQGHGMSAETIRAIEAGRGLTGVGIAGMRERLRLIGGRLEIESGGQGTTVRAIVPRMGDG